MKSILSFGYVFISLHVIVSIVQGQAVETEYGRVIGKITEINLNTRIAYVTSFWGIPYATPPLGDLRFTPPRKHPGWMEDFVADTLPNACMQSPAGLMLLTHPKWTHYSEDCLALNIHKPRDVIAPLPVMVWFHGGGYNSGSSFQYPGHFLAAHDVIVVTVNYRLGVFGFASTADREIGGNMGMLDQLMALEFVRDNIANFGGNPNRVTIFGQSAGSGSTALHLVSPKSKGLFHQAILESAVESNLFVVNTPDQNPDSYIYQVAANLNCTYTTQAELIACLRGADARDLRIADSIQCTPGYFCLGFVPIVDGPGGFLPDLPLKLREQLGEDSVPLISGLCKDDGSPFTLFFIPEAVLGGFTREEFQFYLRTRLLETFRERFLDDVDFENVYQAFDWFYTPWPYIDDEEANRQAINKILTDVAIMYPWDRNAKMNSQYRDTYTYIHSFLSPNSTSSIPEWMGVPHNGELAYVWGYGYLPINPEVRDESGIHFDYIGWTPEDMTYAEYMQTLWTNFAKYGNPTPTPVPDPFNSTTTIWPKYSINDNLKVLDLDATVSVKQNWRQPESYFYTEYLSYLSKVDIKSAKESKAASKANGPEPRKKFQIKSSMFQDAMTRQVYEMMKNRFSEMRHLSIKEFKQLYDH